jgi:hypothetical protein
VTHLLYTPAASDGWLAVATDGQLLLVHSTTPADAAAHWAAAHGGIREALARVRVAAAGGEHTLDGSGVSTWTEQIIGAVSNLDVVIGPAGSPQTEPWMPLVSGAALVSRVSWTDAPPVTPQNVANEQPKPELEPVHETESKLDPAPEVKPAPAPEPHPESVVEITMVDAPIEATILQPDGEADGYDHLFGATMFRSVSEAAVSEPEDESAGEPDALPEAESSDESLAGDHDGMTVMSGDLRRLRSKRSPAPAAAPVPDASPTLYLQLSTGGRETLSRQPVLVGRAPTATKVSGAALPRLVTIPGDKDISRNHAQITLEGGTVVVTDLHSRNGTQVVMPGKSAQQLRQGEPTSVIVGTVVDLGGGVTLTVCEES